VLNFSVGPVMMEQSILNIAAEQIPYFRTEEFSELMLENEILLKKIAKASELSRVIFLTASGTGAMEASIMNLFNRQDRILIVNGGSFGKRFKELCEVYDLKYEEIKLKYGESLSQKHLINYENKGFTGFLINMHETSTGVLYDMELVKEFCERNQLLLVVDAISSFLADPFNMEKLGVNVTILSSQKALALPPGMSYVILDENAQERVANNNIRSLYFNFNNYLSDGKRGQTPYTPAVSNLIQLNNRLKTIDEQGIDNIVSRVANIAKDFRNKIVDLPFEIATKNLSNALTPLKVRGKMSPKEIFEYLKNNKEIFVCPNGGELGEIMFRVGHIGALTEKDNDRLIHAFKSMNDGGIL
jgi:aspartate aminotransferase-like enzyme